MAKSKDNTPAVVAQTVMLPIGKIETNHGQIDGLPKNPRVLRDHHYDALKKSIEDNPEMLTYRELLVFPHKGKYVVIGGNMRLKVLQDLGEKLVPCKIIAEDTPVEKLAAYVIKDNVSGGEWDWDELANAWDEDLLKGWGLELPPDWGSGGIDIIDDEDEAGANTKDIKLSWGSRRVTMTADEQELMNKMHDEYTKANQTSLGFVYKLFEKWKQ